MNKYKVIFSRGDFTLANVVESAHDFYHFVQEYGTNERLDLKGYFGETKVAILVSVNVTLPQTEFCMITAL